MGRPKRIVSSGSGLEINYPSGEPLPYQMEFHSSRARYRAIVGGYGCGKTTAGVIEALKICFLYPGTLGFIGRADTIRLKLTTMEILNEICPPELIRRRNEHDKVVEFINGSRIVYGGLAEEYDSIDKIKSLNLGFFFIDQAEEVSYDVFLALKGRLRRSNSPRCGFIAANPRGKNWIYKLFITKELLSEGENPDDYQAWVVPTYENKYLPSFQSLTGSIHT